MHNSNHRDVFRVELVHETERKPSEQPTPELAFGEQIPRMRIGKYLDQSALNFSDEGPLPGRTHAFRKIWPPQSARVQPEDERQRSPKRGARVFQHLVCRYSFNFTTGELSGPALHLCKPLAVRFRINDFLQTGNQPFGQAGS